MKRFIAVPATAAVAIAALTGCSTTSKSGAGTLSPSASSAPSTVASPSVTRPIPSTPAARTSSTPPPDLKTQLLTVQELPTGWAVDNSTSSDSNTRGCDAVKNIGKGQSDSKAEASFAKGGSLPQFSENLGYFSDKGKADSSYAEGVAALNSCKQLIVKSDGKDVRLTFGRMSLPSKGDHSQAYACTGVIEGVWFGLYFDVVQMGTELILTSYDDLGTPDVNQFQTLRDKAIAKIG